ncbi:MAG TPA: hypothetical protein VHM23_28000 [Actinomycetota bacterium]|jgi:hypothetical protein|nr:hypothetical protein [Actinomycetota bacterium]
MGAVAAEGAVDELGPVLADGKGFGVGRPVDPNRRSTPVGDAVDARVPTDINIREPDRVAVLAQRKEELAGAGRGLGGRGLGEGFLHHVLGFVRDPGRRSASREAGRVLDLLDADLRHTDLSGLPKGRLLLDIPP